MAALRLENRLAAALLIPFIAVGQVGVGLAASRSVGLAVIVGALVAATAAGAFNVMYVAVVAVPATVLTHRLAGGGLDLSYADAVLVVCTLLCLTRAAWTSPAFHRVGAFFGAYLALLAVPLFFNPTVPAAVEWAHRLHLLFGSLIVGSAIARSGMTAVALRLYLLAAAVLSIGAIQYSLTHDFEPAYPFGIHKNGAGFFIVCALILLYIAHEAARMPAWVRPALGVLLLAGVYFCHSRASAATFILVLFITSVRRGRRGIAVPLLGSLALVAMIWTSTQAEARQDEATAKFNSIETRVDTYEQALTLWRENPVFGAGIRYFRDPTILDGGPAGEPHNLAISALAESGLVGLVALTVLHVGILSGLRSRRDPVGLLAYFVIIAHAVDSLAGIFWVAGTGTLPWIILGLATATSVQRDDRNGPIELDGRVAAPS